MTGAALDTAPGRPRAVAPRVVRGALRLMRPERLPLVLAALGWAGLLLIQWWAGHGDGAAFARVLIGGHAHATAPDVELAGAGPAGVAVAQGGDAALMALGAWGAMVAAMMLPTVGPAVRYVSAMSRPSARHPMVLAFVAGYTAAWLVPGAVVALAVGLFPPPGELVLVGAAVAASAWELTRWKRRALSRCCRTSPIRLRGWPAYRSAAGFGLRNAAWCLLACGPAMVVLALAGHPLVATVVVAGLLAAEKLLRRGASLRPWAAATGLVLAAALIAG